MYLFYVVSGRPDAQSARLGPLSAGLSVWLPGSARLRP
ncbi:hypothetical protein SAMN05421678_102517 [Actinopolymorpha cephalotaxi]|uniref:Uncharacterized protein n=1 Tax=Actinopolymorpha cephalotaxi TaxID=504797 RepID=A0A1I2MBH3_9ACTN|nr:hypothetical protein [Actinopolymorpha cephalotaxi]SFF88280.1 hypothetical protein SAMN05421678_102517 [Actinopolymorpha cephalotaxi]